MALPFLPYEHIEPIFNSIQRKAATESLKSLCTYIRQTWIISTVWPPRQWSNFRQSVRTNNDTEGWHRRLNHRGRPNLNFYLLIQLLHNESRDVSIQVRLVSEKELWRHQRKTYAKAQKLYFEYWDQYEAGEKAPGQLLRACSRLHGPIIE